MDIPNEVKLLDNGVKIFWADKIHCIYPYKYLRSQCGCASCVEEMTGRKLLNVSTIPEDIIVVDYFEVGKYALQFLWSDGHSTGIYPYNILRKMSQVDKSEICE